MNSNLSLIAIGSLASFLAGMMTFVGALPILFMRRISDQLMDSLLGFSAGVMLAATSFSLILPAIEAGGGHLRGANVSICAAANAGGTACGGAGDWANGWIVFVDTAGTGTLANQSDRLRLQEPLPNGATVASGSANLIFSNQGFLTSGGANLGLSASGCTGNHGRTINISASGKIDVSAAACP